MTGALLRGRLPGALHGGGDPRARVPLAAVATLISATRTPDDDARRSATRSAPGARVWRSRRRHAGPAHACLCAGKHTYQVVRLTIDPQPWLRAHDTSIRRRRSTTSSRSTSGSRCIEAVSAARDVTILATPEVQKLLAAMPTVDDHRGARVPGVRRQGVLQSGPRAFLLHADDEATGPTAARVDGAGRSDGPQSVALAGCHRLQRTRDLTKYERGE